MVKPEDPSGDCLRFQAFSKNDLHTGKLRILVLA